MGHRGKFRHLEYHDRPKFKNRIVVYLKCRSVIKYITSIKCRCIYESHNCSPIYIYT